MNKFFMLTSGGLWAIALRSGGATIPFTRLAPVGGPLEEIHATNLSINWRENQLTLALPGSERMFPYDMLFAREAEARRMLLLPRGEVCLHIHFRSEVLHAIKPGDQVQIVDPRLTWMGPSE